jgi:serine/threonine protein kinase
VLYECITGRKPFDGDSITAITHMIAYTQPEPISGVSDYWQGIISKALAKNPEERYKSASEMLSDVRNRRTPVVVRQAPVQPPVNQDLASQTTFAPPPPQPYYPPASQGPPPSHLPPPIPPGYYGPPPGYAKDSGLGTAGIILGIIGFFFTPLAVGGLICGIVASQRDDPRGGCATGISIVALIIGFVVFIAMLGNSG